MAASSMGSALANCSALNCAYSTSRSSPSRLASRCSSALVRKNELPMPACSWLSSSCLRCSLKNSTSLMPFDCNSCLARSGSYLPSAPLKAGTFWISVSTRPSLTWKCSSSRRFSSNFCSTSCSRMLSWMRARCSTGISVPNCCDQRACVSLQALVASVAGILSPSTTAASWRDVPLKSRELEPPQNVKINAIGASANHASHLRRLRPSRRLCSIACPEQVGPEKLAERTGLEPATPGVTGRYSNQLNYRSNFGGC
jgi:hypothetical protein